LPDLSTLPDAIRTIVESSYGEAIADLFLVAVPLGLVALVAVAFLREVPLGTRTGLELRRALDEAAAAEPAEMVARDQL
jgi:hypothetical protein